MCPDSLALGQHSQCAQSLLSPAQLLCQSPSPNQNSNNTSPTSSLPPSPTFAPFSFLTQILCCIRVIFFLSLSQGPAQSHPPPPESSELPHSASPVCHRHSCLPLPRRIPRLPEGAGLIHSSRKESSSGKQQCTDLAWILYAGKRPGGWLAGTEAVTGGGS